MSDLRASLLSTRGSDSSLASQDAASDVLKKHAGNAQTSWGDVKQVFKDSYNKVSFVERCSAWAKELTTSRADRSWSDWGRLLIGKISWLQGDQGDGTRDSTVSETRPFGAFAADALTVDFAGNQGDGTRDSTVSETRSFGAFAADALTVDFAGNDTIGRHERALMSSEDDRSRLLESAEATTSSVSGHGEGEDLAGNIAGDSRGSSVAAQLPGRESGTGRNSLNANLFGTHEEGGLDRTSQNLSPRTSIDSDEGFEGFFGQMEDNESPNPSSSQGGGRPPTVKGNEKRGSAASSVSEHREGEDLAGDIAGGPWDLPEQPISSYSRPVSLLTQALEEQDAKDEKYQKNLQTFDKIPAESNQVAPAESNQVAHKEVTSAAKDDFKVSYEHTFSVRFTKEEQDAALKLFKTASKTLKESPRASDRHLTSDSVGMRSLARSQKVNYESALEQYNEALAGLNKVGLSFNSQTREVSKKKLESESVGLLGIHTTAVASSSVPQKPLVRMNTMSFEDAVREVRDKFRPVDLNQTTDAHPKATEADVQKAIGEIDQVSKNPADKIRIATQLKDDANNKFLKVGTSAEGGHLTGLPLASAKREQRYLVDVYAAVLSQLSPK